MIPNQAVYVMSKGKRKFTPCGKCGYPVKPGRKYTIDPENTTIIYHAECYRQLYNKYKKG